MEYSYISKEERETLLQTELRGLESGHVLATAREDTAQAEEYETIYSKVKVALEDLQAPPEEKEPEK